MSTSEPDPNRITTRSLARLSPNGYVSKNRDNSEEKTNEEILDICKRKLEVHIDNDKTITIPKLDKELNFYAWINISGYKSLKKGQKMLKIATNLVYDAFF